MPRTSDYHGLSAQEALCQFVIDYQKLRKGPGSGTLQIVHGYGSTGEGGIIKKLLREVLDFEAGRGVLTFKISEDIEGHPGYTIVLPKAPLLAVPAGLLCPPLHAQNERAILRAMNSRLDPRPAVIAARDSNHMVTLDLLATTALEQLPIASAEERIPPPKRPGFAELYRAQQKSDQ